MNIKELVAKGFIDVNDDISFETKAEVMSLFGFKTYNARIGFYRTLQDPNVHLWFPLFYQDDKNDWENTWGQNEQSVFERRKRNNEDYVAEVIAKPDWHVRILFAKIQPYGRLLHKFKGVYEYDADLTLKAKKLAYVRTATQAKLYSI